MRQVATTQTRKLKLVPSNYEELAELLDMPVQDLEQLALSDLKKGVVRVFVWETSHILYDKRLKIEPPPPEPDAVLGWPREDDE